MENIASQPDISSESFAQPQQIKALRPGIENFFTDNASWLQELGYKDPEAFNGAVDTFFAKQDEYDRREQIGGKHTVLIPNADAFTSSFLKHMEINKDSYRQVAQKRKEARLEEEAKMAIIEEAKPLRKQRAKETRGRMERTSDALFKAIDTSEIDTHTGTKYWTVSRYDLPNYDSNWSTGPAIQSISEEFPDLNMRPFEDAAYHLDDYNFKSPIKRLMKKADEILLIHDGIFDSKILATSALTVGEYGAEASQKIAQTTAVIGKLLKENQDAFVGLHEEFGHMLVRSLDVQESNEPIPMLSLYEGVLSIGQALNLLIQQKIEGYDTPESLVEALVSQGVLLKFAKSFSTMGIIGPMSLTGKFIPGLVRISDKHDGKLVLDEKYVDAQAKIRQSRIRTMSGKVATSILSGESFDVNRPETVLTLEGCPATTSSYNPETGKTRNVALEVTELFMSIYRKINQNEIESPKTLTKV